MGCGASTDASTHAPLFEGHSDWVCALVMAPDGKTLYSGSDDNTVRAWALPGGKCVATLKGHSNAVTSLAMAPDGETLYSVGQCRLTPG